MKKHYLFVFVYLESQKKICDHNCVIIGTHLKLRRNTNNNETAWCFLIPVRYYEYVNKLQNCVVLKFQGEFNHDVGGAVAIS